MNLEVETCQGCFFANLFSTDSTFLQTLLLYLFASANAFVVLALIIKNTQFSENFNQIREFNNKIIIPKHVRVLIMIFIEKNCNFVFELKYLLNYVCTT